MGLSLPFKHKIKEKLEMLVRCLKGDAGSRSGAQVSGPMGLELQAL